MTAQARPTAASRRTPTASSNCGSRDDGGGATGTSGSLGCRRGGRHRDDRQPGCRQAAHGRMPRAPRLTQPAAPNQGQREQPPRHSATAHPTVRRLAAVEKAGRIHAELRAGGRFIPRTVAHVQRRRRTDSEWCEVCCQRLGSADDTLGARSFDVFQLPTRITSSVVDVLSEFVPSPSFAGDGTRAGFDGTSAHCMGHPCGLTGRGLAAMGHDRRRSQPSQTVVLLLVIGGHEAGEQLDRAEADRLGASSVPGSPPSGALSANAGAKRSAGPSSHQDLVGPETVGRRRLVDARSWAGSSTGAAPERTRVRSRPTSTPSTAARPFIGRRSETNPKGDQPDGLQTGQQVRSPLSGDPRHGCAHRYYRHRPRSERAAFLPSSPDESAPAVGGVLRWRGRRRPGGMGHLDADREPPVFLALFVCCAPCSIGRPCPGADRYRHRSGYDTATGEAVPTTSGRFSIARPTSQRPWKPRTVPGPHRCPER